MDADELDGRPATYWVETGSQALLAYRSGDLEIRIRHHAGCTVESTSRSTR